MNAGATGGVRAAWRRGHAIWQRIVSPPNNGRWICGDAASGNECVLGPDGRGQCRRLAECYPVRTDGVWTCTRSAEAGGPCGEGPDASGSCSQALPPCKPLRSMHARLTRFARYALSFAVVFVFLFAVYAGNSRRMDPGPISLVHGAIGECRTCHTNVSEGRLGWLHSLASMADPRGDSAACASCHKMDAAALNPHGLKASRLEQHTKRLREHAEKVSPSLSTRIGNAVFPVSRVLGEGVFCGTCHREHMGLASDLLSVPDERCQACHVVQFRTFRNGHPEFGNYPFKRRTRINFDHLSHFSKHFPEEKEKGRRKEELPETCSNCHQPAPNGAIMQIRSFEEVCSACHLQQIVGKERVAGPKGIPVITIPGLDVQTLKDEGVDIGEWPEFDEAELTPFMRLLIGTDEKRAGMFQQIESLDLLDLSDASPEQLSTVAEMAWAIKSTLYSLIMEGTAQSQDWLNANGKTPVDKDMAVQLLASLPLDVLKAAQREWLPGLMREMEQREQGDGGQADAPKDPKSADAPQDDETKTGEADGNTEKPTDEILTDKQDSLEADAAASDDAQADADDTAQSEAGESDIDAESWAEFGGWYRRDFAILYKPTGHQDTFFKAWLDFSGRRYATPNGGPAKLVFDRMTHSDAQGSCAKCHSIDDRRATGRIVNWHAAPEKKSGPQFTQFSHQPHLAAIGSGGCLSCHALSDEKGYGKTYEAFDPFKFVSNFKPVKKTVCTDCHNGKAVGEDCTLCHTYHVDGVRSPIIATKIPEK